MSTTRLGFSKNIEVQKLGGKSQEIEVTAGESHYFISPTSAAEEYTFHLRHPHSQVLITAFVKAAGESVPFLKTRVVHHSPHSKAETLVRTLVFDKAEPHYEGLIVIEDGAQESESYLNHHSLLLGEHSKSHTLPSLEIKANNVKCSHASREW